MNAAAPHAPAARLSVSPASERGMPVWKRGFDILLSLLALLIAAPLVALVALYIKAVSPSGPVLFRQVRVGHRGAPFCCLKFRTMQPNASASAHQSYCRDLIRRNLPMVKLDTRNDGRLIPGGWILRAAGVDELPQLVNILRGEMSVVGPRPCLPSEFEECEEWQKARVEACPGLTGLWQVSGKNRMTFSQMVQLDIFYGQRASLWLDLKIIAKTVPVLLDQVRETFVARKSWSAGKQAKAVAKEAA